MNPIKVRTIARMDQMLCDFEEGLSRWEATSKKLSEKMLIDESDFEIMKAAVFAMTAILRLRADREEDDESIDLL